MYQFIFPQLTFKKPVKKNQHAFSPICFLDLMSHVSVCFEEINGCLSVIHSTARLWGYCTLYGICSSSLIKLTGKGCSSGFFLCVVVVVVVQKTKSNTDTRNKQVFGKKSQPQILVKNLQVDTGNSCIHPLALVFFIAAILHL